MGVKGSGRPRKPSAKLKLHGTFREDRHGGRFDDSALSAEIPEPSDATAQELALWRELVPQLKATGAKSLDRWAVAGLVQLYIRWQTLMKSDDGFSPATANAFKAWATLAGKFGLTPADRAKLAETPERAEDSEERFRKLV